MRTSSQYYGKAILSAFIACTVLALAYLVCDTFNPVPELSMIHWMSAVFGRPADPIVGWLAHFILGSIVGGTLFAWISPHLFGRMWVRGAVFGLLVSVVVLTVALPMTDAGMFGKNYAPLLPLTIVFMKVIWGIVMGQVYGTLLAEQSKPASDRIGDINESKA